MKSGPHSMISYNLYNIVSLCVGVTTVSALTRKVEVTYCLKSVLEYGGCANHNAMIDF